MERVVEIRGRRETRDWREEEEEREGGSMVRDGQWVSEVEKGGCDEQLGPESGGTEGGVMEEEREGESKSNLGTWRRRCGLVLILTTDGAGCVERLMIDWIEFWRRQLVLEITDYPTLVLLCFVH